VSHDPGMAPGSWAINVNRSADVAPAVTGLGIADGRLTDAEPSGEGPLRDDAPQITKNTHVPSDSLAPPTCAPGRIQPARARSSRRCLRLG